jgi:hypothetical protein
MALPNGKALTLAPERKIAPLTPVGYSALLGSLAFSSPAEHPPPTLANPGRHRNASTGTEAGVAPCRTSTGTPQRPTTPGMSHTR